MGFTSEFMREVEARGLLHQVTDPEGLDALAAERPITAYIGFDCTADSLHVGHLVSIMLLRTLQRTGHRPIALLGGGTSKVGDPSGKDDSRQLLDDEALARNKAGIRRSLEGFLEFGDAPGTALLVDNADWLDGLAYIPFLRQIGRHFTINRMLTFDSVRLRLDREQPLTFLEFNYMILQAYDFLELSRRYDCRLQCGGSDQWGNIVNGVELGRRIDGRQLFGLTTPLITTASGQKMGKTAEGAVWLNPTKREGDPILIQDERLKRTTKDFDYRQYWRNTEDADVGRFLRLFTDLPLAEIERLETLQGVEINEAKEVLAHQATKLCRGEQRAGRARDAAQAIYHRSGSVSGTTVSLGAVRGLPTIELAQAELAGGVSVLELFRLAGLASSNGEARRLIRGGGARLNDERLVDETRSVGPDDLVSGALKLSAGKKRHVLIRAV